MFVQINPTTSLRLERCSGERYMQGDFRACDCEAHFDPNQETEDGELDNAYPNSLLSWVGLLAASLPADDLIAVDPETGKRPDWITVHYNDALFCSPEGEPMAVWVVSLHPAVPDWHFAALFNSRSKAAEFAADSVALGG